MIIIAASLYLPEHIATVLNRAWFYYAGDEAAHVPAGGTGPGASGIGKLGNSEMYSAEILDRLGAQ